jgi:hypothetical protein
MTARTALIFSYFRPGNIFFAFLLIFFAAGWGACNNDGGSPDVSHISVKLDTRRLDLDFAKIDTVHPGRGLAQLAGKYPDFLSFYTDTLMGMGINGNYSDTASAVRNNLRSYLTHRDFRGLADTLVIVFPDTKSIDRDLAKGFQYLKFYYPRFRIPKIIYLNSYLTKWSAFTYGDEIIGIGLDMYLGPQYPNYPRVDIPDYIIRNLRPEAAPVNVFSSIYSKDHPFVTESRTLLDMMLQRGKEQYFLSKMIPFVPEAIRFGFTAAQLDWCNKNEAGIYNFFLKEQLLYDTNWQKILRYVTEGPAATGMSPESPGNVGSWLGYCIVQAYANTHPDAKLDEVLAKNDAQAMLQEARYKPKQ